MLTGELLEGSSPAAQSAWRRQLSLATLVGSNALILVGVAFLDWELFTVMAVYWSETAVVGAFNVLKMIRIHPLGGAAGSVFFCVHFGLFMFVHGVFVIALFGPADLVGPEAAGDGDDLAALLGIVRSVWPVVVALVASHGVSFVVNFLGEREYEGRDVNSQMGAPYGRVVVMHLTILVGGFLSMVVGTPAPALVVLVLLKTAVDAWAHLREHREKAPAGAGDPRSTPA